MYKYHNKFVAIIPARAGSKEIKKKNLFKIGGHSLVSYSIEAAKKSKFIKNVFVSTDGKEIAKESKKYGAKIILRPKKISKNSSQIEDSILHAIDIIENKYNQSLDNIVLLQPTSPLRKIDDIDKAIKKFVKDKADSLFSCVDLHPCIWNYKNFKNFPLNYDIFKRPNRQNMQKTLIENGSIYITKKKIYKKRKNRLAGKISNYIMENYSTIEADTKNDIKFFDFFLNPKVRKKFKLINPKKIK